MFAYNFAIAIINSSSRYSSLAALDCNMFVPLFVARKLSWLYVALLELFVFRFASPGDGRARTRVKATFACSTSRLSIILINSA